MRRSLLTLSVVALGFGLSACDEGGDTGPADGDGDGYLSSVDCDDGEAAIHPGAQELGNDGIDNDCDDLIDCDDDDVARTFDGDVGEADVATVCDRGCPIEVTGSITLDATALTDLDPLSCVTAIDGDLYVRQNDELTSISGLAALTTVGGNVSIGEYWCEYDVAELAYVCTGSGNSALASYDGLQNLESVGGWLWLADNDLLVDPGVSFDKLVYVGGQTAGMSLLIDGHAAMTQLPDFPALTSVGAYTEVWGNDELTDLSGLSALQWAEWLSIAYNPALDGSFGLDALSQVGTLGFVDNGNTSMVGLEALTTVDNALEIWFSPTLLSLEGLGALQSVGLWLSVINDDGLTDLHGLDSLTWLGAGLNIMDNDGLVSVDGAESLTTLDGALQIMGYLEEGNASLVDLEGLWGIEKVSSDVTIQGNASLPDAEAQALVDHIEHICGTVTIEGNGG